MKFKSIFTTAITTSLLLVGSSAMAHHVAVNGNGLPHIKGKVNKLLLNAYDNCPKNEFEGSNRNSIALLANFDGNNRGGGGIITKKENTISLLVNSGMPDFTVVDGNACNSDGAAFTLPNGALFDEWDGDDGLWAVFVRMRGQPGTGINMALCYTDKDSVVVCDTGDVVDVTRGNGKPAVLDATRELLGFDTEPLTGEDAFWDVVTEGRAKATLYFYDCDDLNELPGNVGEAC
jgi:hypothetical protein